jgi:hypothetical protein
VIRIDNPFMPEATPFNNKKLWFDINEQKTVQLENEQE